MSITTTTLLLLAATDSLLRSELHRITLAVYRNNATCISGLVKAIVTLNLELFRLELVALLHEVIDSVNPAHLYRLRRFVHITKTGQDLLVELGHNDLLVLILKIAGTHHVIDYFLQRLAEGSLAVNVRLAIVYMLHSSIGLLVWTGTFHHFFFWATNNYKDFSN